MIKKVVGTRGSKLALTQTQWVIHELEKHFSEVSFEIKVITTKGDLVQDKPLEQIGSKGLFTSEIEEGLLDKSLDFAVHSMKDMPAKLPEGLCFAGIPLREDPRDVLILKEGYHTLEELPRGAKIATGSKRRSYQLLALRPDLEMLPIRGNVDTRIRKLKEQNLDGIVLAAAGIHRLGLHHHITCYLSLTDMLPSPGQGALAIELRSEDEEVKKMLSVIEDPISTMQVATERSFLEAVNGTCQMPIGAYCEVSGGHLRLRGLIGDEEGERLMIKELSAPIGCEVLLGQELGRRLRKEFEENVW